MGLIYSLPYTGEYSPKLPIIGLGKYKVSCSDLMIDGGNDSIKINDEGKKEIDKKLGTFVRLYYPNKINDFVSDGKENSDKEKKKYPLWVPRTEYFTGLADYQEMSRIKLRTMMNMVVGQRRIPATWQEKLIEGEDNNISDKFPVIIFSHGLSGCRHFYTVVCTALASYGYIVAALEHRDLTSCWTYKLSYDNDCKHKIETSIPMRMVVSEYKDIKLRGKQVMTRVKEYEDLFNVLEQLNIGALGTSQSRVLLGDEFDWGQFTNKLDLSNTFLVGHSFGATSAIAALGKTDLFKAAVCLDAWMDPIKVNMLHNIDKPCLFFNIESFQFPENVKRILVVNKDGNKRNGFMYTFKDAVHQSFSDFSFIHPGYIGKAAGLQGSVDPLHIGEVTMEMIHSYFQKLIIDEDAKESLEDIRKRYDFIVNGTTLEVNNCELVEKL
uniref:1-alkyl-2-acetylglycerophosphocholine esterase n=1 Tax=Parastrongyloides trichosuri TaxID=131310 RepID=A0A0N4Z480_PARTI